MSDDVKRRAYRGLFAVNFMIALGFGIVDPFFPVYAVGAGATGLHIALIFSAYAAAKMLLSPLAGWWSDRRGRRGLIVAGLGTYLAVSLGYLLMPGPLTLVVLRILQGVGAALVRPVSLACIGDMAPARKEARTMGTFDISFYGAQAVGPVIGGAVQDTAGFPGVFLGLAALCFLALLAALLWVTASSADTPGHTDRTPPHPGGPGMSAMLIGLSGFILTRSFSITLFAVFIPIFMYGSLKLTGLEMGIIMGAGTVVTALLLRPMGGLSDRLNRRRLVVLGGSMAALLTFCLPSVRSFGHLLALSVAIGVFRVVSLPASSALLVREGNRCGMGFAMGVFNGAMNLGTVLAPLAGGLALGAFGIEGIFHGAAFLGLAGAVFFALCTMPGIPKRRDAAAGAAREDGGLSAVEGCRRLSLPESAPDR